MAKCELCDRRPAGERDAISPYCGKCDPNGAHFYVKTLVSDMSARPMPASRIESTSLMAAFYGEAD